MDLNQSVIKEHLHSDSLYINADFNIFTMNLINRVKSSFDKSKEQDKAIAGLTSIKKTHDEINTLIALNDPDKSFKITQLKNSLKMDERKNTMQTKLLWNNMWTIYESYQTTIEDRGGFVLPPNKVIKPDEDFYLVKIRGLFKVEVAIRSECNHGIKVRSYFNTDHKGKFVKGSPNYVEYLNIKSKGLSNVIQELAIRELKEETLLDLNIVDKKRCIITAFGTEFKCYWSDSKDKFTYKGSKEPTITYSLNIKMSCNQYETLKAIIKVNSELIQKHMELNSEISTIIIE
jgi:hypothetical protein